MKKYFFKFIFLLLLLNIVIAKTMNEDEARKIFRITQDVTISQINIIYSIFYQMAKEAMITPQKFNYIDQAYEILKKEGLKKGKEEVPPQPFTFNENSNESMFMTQEEWDALPLFGGHDEESENL